MRRTTFVYKSSMLILTEKDVKQCLDMRTCIEVNRIAFMALATNGQTNVPTRVAIPYINAKNNNNNNNNNNSSLSTSVVVTQPAAELTTTTTTKTTMDWTLFKPAAASLFQKKSIITKDIISDSCCSDNDTSSAKERERQQQHQQDDDDKTTTTTTSHMGIKIVSVRENNPMKYQLPLVPATIVHLHPETGIVDAIVAGTYLTAARTAAGSALSVQYLFQSCSTNTTSEQTATNNNELTTSTSTTTNYSSTTTKPLQEPEEERIQQQERQGQQSQQLQSQLKSQPIPYFHRKCKHVTMFGAGLQAKTHFHAITIGLGYGIEYGTIINRSYERAYQLAQYVMEKGWITKSCKVLLLSDTKAIQETIAISDCIVTTTNTSQPLWSDNDNDNDETMRYNKDGCHFISVGSYTPDMQEIPTSAVNTCSHIYLDTLEAMEVGDLKHIKQVPKTTSTSDTTIQLLGEVLKHSETPVVPSNHLLLLLSPEDTIPQKKRNTFYKSVGTAIQDVLTVQVVVEKAREIGNIGTEINMMD